MIYFLDTEFDGYQGPLLSIGLIRQDGVSFYAVLQLTQPIDSEWVLENVMTKMYELPLNKVDYCILNATPIGVSVHLEEFFNGDDNIKIITDWPADICYLTDLLMVGPGEMIDIDNISIFMTRMDAYPTTLEGAVQHNAWWDAKALMHKWENNNV